MELKDAVKFILERIESETDSIRSHDDLNCPDEAVILAYCEGRVSEQNRAKIYKHIVSCHNCIELLAMFAQISEQEADAENEEAGSGESLSAGPYERELTDKVLEMIEKDEMKFLNSR
jgi:hypothetical protein